MDTPTFRLFYEEIDGSVLLFVSWTGPDIRDRIEAVLRDFASLNKTATGWEVSVRRGGKSAQQKAEELIQKALMLTHAQERKYRGKWVTGPEQIARALPRGQKP